MDFSPDGSLLATANDNRVSLFEREHQWLIRELRGHTARVETVAFGHAGKMLASGSSNGELATWDVATGALIKLRKVKESVITGVKFMSAGKLLTADRGGTVRLWDDGKCQDSCTLAQIDGSLESLAVSVDDKWIAAGDENNTVTVWQFDISTLSAQPYHSLTLPDKRSDDSDFVRGLAFDKMGRLAAVSFSGSLVFQDVPSWTSVFQQHTGLRLDGVAVAPDGSSVYIAGVEGMFLGRVLSFDSRDGSRIPLDELPAYWSQNAGNAGPYRSLAISQDGKWMLAGGPYLLEWDLSMKTPPVLFSEATRIAPGTIFSPSADSVIVPLLGVHLFSIFRGYFATLPLLDLANLPIPLPIGQTAVDIEGRFIAAPGVSRAFSRLVQVTCPSTLPPPQFTQCNQELLQRTNLPPMKSLLLFHESDLTFITELEMDEDPHPTFSQDSALLLWRTKDGFHTVDTACMCNKHDFPIPLPDHGFFDLAIDASVRLVATPQAGTNGRVVQLFSLQTNSIIGTLSLGGSRSVRRLAFNSSRSDEGKILGIGTTSGDVLLWPTNEKTAERIQGSSPVTSLAFSRDGSTLAIGRENGGVSVLSLKTRKVSEIGNAHASSVEAVRFGFGGRWISSLSLDAVQFWDSGDLSKIGTLILPVEDGTLSWLFVNPEGLFEGESRALGSMLWRFSPRLDDVGPVELFEHDYFCQGLMKEVLLRKTAPGRRACKPPALISKNRNLPVLKVSVDIKDKSQAVKSPRVKVDIHIQRAVVAGRPEAVKDVRLLRGGLLVKHWHGVIPESTQDLSTEVPITPGLNEFRAYGFNSDDVKSLDATDGVLGDRSLGRAGTTYILSVGVDDYARGIPPLHYSGNDARAFVTALTGLQSGQTVRVATLVDGDATRENILCGLRRLASDAQNPPSCSSSELNNLQPTNIEDGVYVFFSGHGAAQTPGFALLPKDASYSGPAALGEDQRLRNVISDSDLERELEPILAAQQVLVLDACSAGSLITADESANAPLNLSGFAQLAREKGIYILAAATARQAAMEGPAQGPGSNRSIMNYLLLEEGLIQKKAEANGPNGSLLIEDWFNYAVGHVPSAADQQPVSFLPMRQENTQTGILGFFRK